MEPERWRELERLLCEAMELAPEERAAWLEGHCEGDAELLEEARSLLSLEERSREFLETPALIRDPERIAEYRIVRRLATGGSAVVYEALRDGAEDPVALKVVRGSLFVDERGLRRFRREVKTLARLRHPAIARILDARSTTDGRPFFTMELVRGRQLDRYVREEALSLEDRLWLFRELCDAIHYAHGCGVIHRDVKPSNILVDEDGRAKILDFGLARLVESGASRTTSVHDLGAVMGTLPYMSPEQASGRSGEVDARTDVYSLGVVLYELTTGELPHDFTGLTPYEGLNLVCHHEPIRPSVRRRELRGPLETIVLQAMHKEPGRRYRSAAELGADVGRYLEGRSVVARPPHPVQRLRATVAAHKLASATLAAALLGLSVFSVTAWSKNRELEAQKEQLVRAREAASNEAARAGLEAERAQAVLDFLTATLDASNPDHGLDVTVREVLDEVADGVDTDFAEQPYVRSEIHRTLGLCYLSLGRDREATRHFESYLALSAELDPRPSLRRAEGHRSLAEALMNRSHYEAALVELERSLALHRELHPDDLRTAGVLQALGSALFELGRREESEERDAEALELARAHGSGSPVPSTAPGAASRETPSGPEDAPPEGPVLGCSSVESTPSDPADSGPIASDEIASRTLPADDAELEELELEADLRWKQGQRAEAERLYREILALRPEGETQEPRRTGRVLSSLARLAIEGQRFEEARELFVRSLDIRSRSLGPDHPETVATRSNLGTIDVQLGRYAEAEPILLDVLEHYRAEGRTQQEDYAITLSTLGATCSNLGRDEDAERYFREALEVFRASSSGRQDALASHALNLARALIPLERFAEAEDLATEALDLRTELFGERSPETAGAVAVLAQIQLGRGDAEGAVAVMREALATWRAALPPGHPEIVEGTNTLAAFLFEAGELEEAEGLYRESLENCAALYGESNPDTALRRANLGELLLERGRPEEAAEQLRRAFDVVRGAGPGAGPRPGALLSKLAAAELARGRPAEAALRLEELLAEDTAGELDELERCDVLHRVAEAYAADGRAEEARAQLVAVVERLNELVGPGDARLVAARNELARLDGGTTQLSEASFDAEER